MTSTSPSRAPTSSAGQGADDAAGLGFDVVVCVVVCAGFGAVVCVFAWVVVPWVVVFAVVVSAATVCVAVSVPAPGETVGVVVTDESLPPQGTGASPLASG